MNKSPEDTSRSSTPSPTQASKAKPICVSTLSEQQVRSVLGDIVVNEMVRQNLALNNFQWIIPADEIKIRTGEIIKSGYCAYTEDNQLCSIQYSATDGIQLVGQSADDVIPVLEEYNRTLVLTAVFKKGTPIISLSISLDEADKLFKGRGHWLSFWEEAIAKKLTLASSKRAYGFVTATNRVPENNRFSTQISFSLPVTIWGMSENKFATFPDLGISDLNIINWSITDNTFTVFLDRDGIPNFLEVKELTGFDKMASISDIRPLLPSSKEDRESLDDAIKNVGVFSVKFASERGEKKIALKKDGNSLVVLASGDDQTRFTQGYWYDNVTVLVGENGKCAQTTLKYEAAERLLKQLAPHDTLLDGPNKERWAAVLDLDQKLEVTSFRIRHEDFEVGDQYTVPFNLVEKFTVDAQNADFCKITVTWKDVKGKKLVHLLAPEKLAYNIWQQWDIKRTEVGFIHAGLPDLYRQFNEVKKYNLLFILYADILLLNRQLDAGISMNDLVSRMNAKGPVEFAEDKNLRENTIAKVLLLSLAFPRIKQKFELLATMYPYYWAQQEFQWFSKAFGNEVAEKIATNERKNIIPIVRRHVRLTQANIQRSLAEIEAAIRPLEAILATQEVEKHWSSKVRKYVPAVSQSSLGILMLTMPGGSAIGMRMLGGVVGTHAAGSIFKYFQKDKEAAAQVRRAASTMFPWWEIFMRTLTVSIYESSQFVDEENTRAMKRDRSLLDHFQQEPREKVMKRIIKSLQKRIVEERRNQFLEVLEGSGVRMATVVGDIESAIGPDMQRGLDQFEESLMITGKQKALKRAKDV